MKHPGFNAAAAGIAGIAGKQGIPLKNANAILAAGARHAGKKSCRSQPPPTQRQTERQPSRDWLLICC